MPKRITRRTLVKGGLIASGIVPAWGLMCYAAPAATADLPPLDPKEPTAATLGFITDATKVDTAANPRYSAGQICGNCEQFLGKPTDARGGCVLFADKSVPAAGWCRVWRMTTKT
jgi:hypothetical protein